MDTSVKLSALKSRIKFINKSTQVKQQEEKSILSFLENTSVLPPSISNPKNKPVYKISYSEYSTYMNCPHKWFLSYQLKFPGDASEELLFGSAIHDTIESLLTNSKLRNLAMLNNSALYSIYEDELHKQIKSVTDIDLLVKIQKHHLFPTFYKQGKDILDKLNIFERFHEYEVVDVEYKLDDFLIGETEELIILFKGYIDLVLRHKKTGRYLILDWKTSGKAWDITKKEKNKDFYNQIILYKYFYSKAKDIPMSEIDLCFFNLPRAESNNLSPYYKNFTEDEVLNFKKKFEEDCKEMLSFNILELKKSKHITKNNFCHRCKFNKEETCNDIDEYQVVSINEKDKLK